ncbi:helix-turn-helix transcriptional regulator [Rhizobiaceae bacterium BDR2-2]|uniref:Helix-turn-helix transcriptional regulator n=1 Tax=Ectorhizobium quercum TaxID=2965071 RepID=A0AAE3SVW3_9HYPH|nr:AraC family transcriptional regulator [Ectorhizobium quercum]MCX8997389.1 helix-turn-helix transcriptional regulator [Ectorhizobium quercum]
MTIENFSAANADPDLLSELVSKPTCTVRYEPLKTSLEFDYAVNISTLGSLITLQSVSRHGFLARAEMGTTDRLELHFIEEGYYHSETSHQNVAGGAGQAFLLRNVDEHRIVCRPGTRQTCVAIPVERCARLFAMDVDDPCAELMRFSSVADFHSGALKSLHGMTSLLGAVDSGEHPLADAPLGAALLEEAFLSVFVEAWPKLSGRDASQKPSPHYVRKAVDWIEAHAAEKIRLEDIAAAAGVSVRSVQAGFKEQYGLSPIAYILKTRLRHVHRDLLSAEPEVSIAEIARRWGFLHMGDFAMRYRKLFGRTPSQTRHGTLDRF